jgi:succinate-acetate transporter protein
MASMFVVANLFAVYLVVGSFTLLISAFSERRTRALGVVFAVLLLSFLLNFLAQFWEPAKSVSFLSIMEYYRPALIIQSGQFPASDIGILAAISAVCWLLGGFVFRHRSICTV